MGILGVGQWNVIVEREVGIVRSAVLVHMSAGSLDSSLNDIIIDCESPKDTSNTESSENTGTITNSDIDTYVETGGSTWGASTIRLSNGPSRSSSEIQPPQDMVPDK